MNQSAPPDIIAELNAGLHGLSIIHVPRFTIRISPTIKNGMKFWSVYSMPPTPQHIAWVILCDLFHNWFDLDQDYALKAEGVKRRNLVDSSAASILCNWNTININVQVNCTTCNDTFVGSRYYNQCGCNYHGNSIILLWGGNPENRLSHFAVFETQCAGWDTNSASTAPSNAINNVQATSLTQAATCGRPAGPYA